jgi:hypothetical protein
MDKNIKNFQSRFKYKFDMDSKAIDLREMMKNYEDNGGIIPLEDIHQAIKVIYDPGTPKVPVDPYKDSEITHNSHIVASQTDFVEWKDLYLWPLFQRDVSPNHIKKIYNDFDPTAVITPCVVKFTIKGKTYYCVWDGHHTLQDCRFAGYTKFKIDYIDIDDISDEKIKADGWDPSDKIGYGIWLAGSNMIRINSKNKRPLAAYDEFMIKLETKDHDTVQINNILAKHDTRITRKPHGAGSCSQVKSVIECYELEDSRQVRGRFLDRAVQFHRTNWPGSPMELELFRPMAYLYQQADIDGIRLDADWDKEMAEMLINNYGDPETIQTKLKESYWRALDQGQGKGKIPGHDKDRVLNGLLNLYHQKGGSNVHTPRAEYVWQI